MPKNQAGPRFNWTQKRSGDIARAVRRYNLKLTNIGKAHPELKPLLPPRITVKELREKIKTQKELNAQIRVLNAIYEPSAIDIVANPTTGEAYLQYDVATANILTKFINQRRKARRPKKDVITTQKGNLPEPEEEVSKKVNRNQFNSFKQFQNYVRAAFWSQYDAAKVERYHLNHLKGVDALTDPDFGPVTPRLIELTNRIKELITNLSDDEFFQIYTGNPDDFEISQYYDPRRREEHAEQILAHWESAIAKL